MTGIIRMQHKFLDATSAAVEEDILQMKCNQLTMSNEPCVSFA